MIKFSLSLLFTMLVITQLITLNAFAQVGTGDSPFERKFGDVKFLDAYFGTTDEKIEVEPGDKNVPFTIIMANVGTQDITGILGQLSLPLGFSPSDGSGSLIEANSDSNSLAGDNFSLTFFVNIGNDISIKQYTASVKVDYSRLTELENLFLFHQYIELI